MNTGSSPEIKMTAADMNKFISGDIGLTTSNNWISRMIRWFTSGQTGNAQKSHALLFADTSLIVEAAGKIRISPSDIYKEETIDVYRILLSEEEKDALKINILREVNHGYGYLKLPLFALDSICTKAASLFGHKEPVFFFTKYFGISSFRVCSQFVVWALHKYTGYRLKDKAGNAVNWKTVSPDYLEDLLKLPHNNSTLIYSQQKS